VVHTAGQWHEMNNLRGQEIKAQGQRMPKLHLEASFSTSVLRFPTRFLPKPKNRAEVFSKPKNRFLAACKPGFSVLNFDLQMSNYATILTQTAYNVHDSMFLFVYIYIYIYIYIIYI